MTNKILGILFFCMTMISCSGFQRAATKNDKATESPQIVFLELLALNQNGELIIKEIGSTMTAGSVKKFASRKDNFNNPVEVHFLDRQGKRLNSSWIEHPLIQIFEYSSPDGELGKTTQISDSLIFYLRYNANQRISNLIFKTTGPTEPTIDFNLKLSR